MARPPNTDSLTYAVEQFANGLYKDALDRMKPHLLKDARSMARSMACAMLRVFQLEHAQHALEGSSNQELAMAINLLKNAIQEPAIQMEPLEAQTLS